LKLLASIDGQESEVIVRRLDGRVFASVDGREYLLEVDELEPGLFHIKSDGRVFEVYVGPNGLTDIGGRQIEVSVRDPKRLSMSGPKGLAADGTIEIRSAMPGKVVRVLVGVGDTVAEGDGIVVVEAMKMQNELKTPREGTVREVRFSEGDTVNGGDLLAVIE
jgi:biotin carboxyl carrier protein